MPNKYQTTSMPIHKLTASVYVCNTHGPSTSATDTRDSPLVRRDFLQKIQKDLEAQIPDNIIRRPQYAAHLEMSVDVCVVL